MIYAYSQFFIVVIILFCFFPQSREYPPLGCTNMVQNVHAENQKTEYMTISSKEMSVDTLSILPYPN